MVRPFQMWNFSTLSTVFAERHLKMCGNNVRVGFDCHINIAIIVKRLQIFYFLNNTKEKNKIELSSHLSYIYTNMQHLQNTIRSNLAWSRHSPAIVKKFAICITLNFIVHQVDIITAIDGGGFLVHMHHSNLTRAILQAAEKFLRAKTSGTALESKRHSILQKPRFYAVERRPQHLHPIRIKRRSQPHHCLYKSLLVIIE